MLYLAIKQDIINYILFSTLIGITDPCFGYKGKSLLKVAHWLSYMFSMTFHTSSH